MTATAAPDRAARVLASFVGARAAFGAVYLGINLGGWRVPWYHPLERRWSLASHPAGLAMGWYGATATALTAALIAGAIVWLAGGRKPVARLLARPNAVPAIARAVALILLVDFAYFGWTLTHQTPAPLPPPPGCSP